MSSPRFTGLFVAEGSSDAPLAAIVESLFLALWGVRVVGDLLRTGRASIPVYVAHEYGAITEPELSAVVPAGGAG